MNNNRSTYLFGFNETNGLYDSFITMHYNKYVFFAVCSALLGLPSNILLLVILMRIGLFSRRQSVLSRLSFIKIQSTGSFERFLFEIVFVDTLLIIYHFVDNFLSYIHDDRSTGQHYLIHVSDFCCKFFTYIAKMSVLLTTWLLLFLIINQLILTMEYNNDNNDDHDDGHHHRHRSCWNRGLYYVNAKYSTVFLVFIFSVYNIYPIEVLKYQKKEDSQDYQQGGVPGVCSTQLDGKSIQLLNVTNYGYNLLGVAIPCIIILVISIIIIYRTCRNNAYMNKECSSFYYIAGTIGILHALFNLPARLSDLLLLFSSAYASSYYPYLINFNHEAQSFITLSYGYKCFICILISRRFRLHAKSVLCFLIESKYEDRYTIERFNANNDWHHLAKLKTHKRYYHHHLRHHHGKDTYMNIIPVDDLERYTTSEATYWIRPYFTQSEKHNLLRPCGRSASCHEISIPFSTISSNVAELPKTYSPNELDISSSHIITDPSSSYIINITLPNGEYVYLPLPQKHASTCRLSSVSPPKNNKTDPSSHEDSLKMTLLQEDIKEQPVNKINFLSSLHVY
ncbi:unnamed protein product [Rotaria sp. Silwood2]|nr:unnamed protein product [Rotaria sp. Silwood2]CAF2907974.1 unnamed protein product [Rotaria sp. Silwood2]CAF3058743.1 unnamed protein product [Rotaria sp. Silwood2]CAF3852061.1 unnamed protein product [Rotaria sp. Silwood2]